MLNHYCAEKICEYRNQVIESRARDHWKWNQYVEQQTQAVRQSIKVIVKAIAMFF